MFNDVYILIKNILHAFLFTWGVWYLIIYTVPIYSYMPNLHTLICRCYILFYVVPIYSYMQVLHTRLCRSYIFLYSSPLYSYMPVLYTFMGWNHKLISLRFSTKFVFFSSLPGHFILSLTIRRPHIFWNVHDFSTFCQNIKACLKSCSEMPG
jgi:hypothetical protein